MSVLLRGSKYHYRFNLNRTIYSGCCEGCTNEREALSFEAARRREAKEEIAKLAKEADNIRRQRTVVALVENYRYELTGGRPIRLDEAFELAAAKPTARRSPSEKFSEQKRLYFRDFVAFMAATFSDVETLSAVNRRHCEAYVRYLMDNGRFIREVTPANGKTYIRDYKLSGSTISKITSACSWVFGRLAMDAGVVTNPWQGVETPANDRTDREIFSPDELQTIRFGISGDKVLVRGMYKGDPERFDLWAAAAEFVRPLFAIGAVTGLTEGDICTLKRAEFNWADRMIYHSRRKTGVKMSIPIKNELEDYVMSLPASDSEYLLPEHARMYLNNASGISYRIGVFLSGLGIETSKKVPGRRAVSVKDLHSMRHVFCYYAGVVGIPLAIVQAIVGHLTPEMTRHYMAHANKHDQLREIEKLPQFLNLFDSTPGASSGANVRRELTELVQRLPLPEAERLLFSLKGGRALIA